MWKYANRSLSWCTKTNYPWGFENHLISALEEMRCEIISTDFRQERQNLQRLLQQKTDLVLVCKGEFIPPELIKLLPYPTALWYCEQIGNDIAVDYTALLRRKELEYNATAFDYVFSHDKTNLQVYKNIGCVNVHWLPCIAVNTKIHKKLEVSKNMTLPLLVTKPLDAKTFLLRWKSISRSSLRIYGTVKN